MEIYIYLDTNHKYVNIICGFDLMYYSVYTKCADIFVPIANFLPKISVVYIIEILEKIEKMPDEEMSACRKWVELGQHFY